MLIPEIKILDNKKYNNIFNNCLNNTFDTTVKTLDDGSIFVITGDIPAMWLRDSSAQVMTYLHFAEKEEVKKLIKGVLNKQFEQILTDAYANAFMENENCVSEWAGMVKTDFESKLVWERKFELDSLCYPLFLLCKFYKKTSDLSVINDKFLRAFDRIIEVVNIEQKHSKLSSYYFERSVPWRPDITEVGLNTNPEEEKGLVWTGFRPSDDKCIYNYHIPDNMFLVSVLHSLSSIFDEINDKKRSKICNDKIAELVPLIEKYGIQEVAGFGKIYVYETNCLGLWHANDDANIPSLLSIPYLEYPFMDKEIYSNTRRYVLSKHNENYFEGSVVKGIGSVHTPKNYVWPMSIIMQGLTSEDENEKNECLDLLFKTTVDNELVHESCDVNNPQKYTRKWFSWANSLFAEFVLNIKK